MKHGYFLNENKTISKKISGHPFQNLKQYLLKNFTNLNKRFMINFKPSPAFF